MLPEPKVTAYGIVRDANGRPKVDGDPDKLPTEIKSALTAEDWAYLRNRNGNS